MGELKQTKGYAQLRGIIGGLDRVKDAITTRKETKQYTDNDKIKKLQFSVKTSEDNVIYVELKQFKTGNALKNVYISKKDEETGKYETIKKPFNERHINFGDGWKIIGVSLKSNNDEYAKSMMTYDAIDYILENFEDGDSVFINAELSHNDNERVKIKYNLEVNKIMVTHEPINFNSEKFIEQSEFQDEFIFRHSYPDEGGLVVVGYTVKYDFTLVNSVYIVKNEDREVIDYIENNLSAGDVVKVIGNINNKVKYNLIEIEQESDTNSNIIGRKTKSEKNKSKPRYEKEIEYEERNLQIIGIDVDSIKKGAYNLSDIEGQEEDDGLPF